MNQLKKNESTELTTSKGYLLYRPEIAISDIENCSMISPKEMEVILACLNNKKIKHLNMDDFCPDQDHLPDAQKKTYDDVLIEILSRTIWEIGITEKAMTKDEQKFFIQVAIEEIKNEFGTLMSVEEVRIALKKGARKHYGEFYGLNITTLNTWFNTYLEETKREAMLKLPYVKPKEEKKKEYSEEERKQQYQYWLNNVYKEFESFKTTGEYTFYDFNNSFYKLCVELKIPKIVSNRKKIMMYQRALMEAKEQFHPANANGFGQRIEFRDVYEKITKSDELDKKYEDLLVMRAKKLTIEHFFKKLVKHGKDLKRVIEEGYDYDKKSIEDKG